MKLKSMKYPWLCWVTVIVIVTSLIIVPVTGDHGQAQDLRAPVSSQTTSGTTWYLAEGSTRGGFETWILVQNPSRDTATVSLTYMTPSGAVTGPSLVLEPSTRQSVNVADTISDEWSVSTEVTSDVPVVCERSVYWGERIGGHDSIGVTSPDHVWYLAEGSTGGDFETWILVQNPNDANATVELTYMTSEGSVEGPREDLLPNSRMTFNIADTLPGVFSVSTKVVSNRPVVCERSVYWGGRIGGHDSIGVTIPGQDWYLAEGSTRGGFETWILVQNPSRDTATVSLTYMTPSGSVTGPSLVLEPSTRQTVNVADTVPDEWSVSTEVTSDVPVVCERSVYWGERIGGHDSIGVTIPGQDWYLAEGSTGEDYFETWILVQNPSQDTATVSLTYMTPSGAVTGPSLVLEPSTRQTVNVADTVPDEWSVSTEVTSDVPVVCERSVYWGGRIGGHDSIGYLPETIEIPDTTKVIDQAMADNIISISSDERIITFKEDTPGLDSIAPDDIMVFDTSDKTPNGMLRGVESIEKKESSIVFTTADATLEEGISRGTVSISRTLVPEDVASSEALAAGVGRLESVTAANGPQFKVPFNVVLYDHDGNENTKSDQIRLSGSTVFEPEFDCKVKIDYNPLKFWDPPKLEQFTFTVSLNEQFDAELYAGISLVEIKKEIEAASYKFSPITFMVGPVPVVIVPTLSLIIGAKGEVSASLKTGVSQEATLTAGVSYNGGVWNTISNFDNDFGYTPPTINAKASARGYVKPQLSLMLYTVAGPHASIEGYLELVAGPNMNPWWQLYGGLQGNVGVEMKIVSHIVASYNKTVFDFKKMLASAEQDEPGPPGPPAPPPPPPTRGERIVFASTSDGEELYSAKTDGTDKRKLFGLLEMDTPITGYDWDISPDGDSICNPHSDDIRVFDLINQGESFVQVDASSLEAPKWSPSGSMFAYGTGGPWFGGIGVINTDGTNKRIVSQESCGAGTPSWSPDGNRIVRDLQLYNYWGIGFIDLGNPGHETGYFTNIMQHGMSPQEGDFCSDPVTPKWSPTGDKILYEGRMIYEGQETQGLYTIEPSVFNLNLILEGNVNGFSWSPDGSRIVYCNDNNEMWIMNRDGQGRSLVTTEARYPLWRSDLYQI